MVEIWIKFRYHYKKRACSRKGCTRMWNHLLEVELDYLVRRATFCDLNAAAHFMSWYSPGQATSTGQPAVYGPNRILCAFVPAYCTVFPLRSSLHKFYGSPFHAAASDVNRLPLPEVAKIEPPGELEPVFKSCLRIYKQKHIFINGGKIFCSSRSYANTLRTRKMLPQSLS